MWMNTIASDIFDISIGKTPPRKEQKWFTEQSNNGTIRWVSISDMGKSGIFIEHTSENLTIDTIDKFNVVVVPDNIVLLSFKLTVGRVAITNGKMCTNEAIAHFKTTDPRLREILYIQLKTYNYEKLGSTSSIATAVNSNTIKSMELLLPPSDQLNEIHLFLNPVLNAIRANQSEISELIQIRNSLLSKLMSGEIDISKLNLSY